MKTLKVFATKAELRDVARVSKPIEKYDAFVVVEAGDKAAAALAKRYPVEDITAQYDLRLPGMKPRAPRPRATYRGERSLAKGPHHYIVQFIAPIKRIWLSRVASTGATLRGPY